MQTYACIWRTFACIGLLALSCRWREAHADVQQGQDPPLQGQGWDSDVQSVTVSVYLDRLLDVDEENYRHEASMYWYIAWIDPTANDTVTALTAKSRNNTYKCQRLCSNYWTEELCCDEIYLPAFSFRNIQELPEGRQHRYSINVDGSLVYMIKYIHAVFYHPMDFRRFPFDSQHLIAEVEFPDGEFNTTLRLGSVGTKLFTVGKGDDVSGWKVTNISMLVTQYPTATLFKKGPRGAELLQREEEGDDDYPLLPGSFFQEPDNTTQFGTTTVLVIDIEVKRFSTYMIVNVILPIVLCVWLGFIVFLLDKQSLAEREVIIVTLFLSLSALQMVIGGFLPSSSYVIPTQQLILLSYAFLGLFAVESAAVYAMVNVADIRKQRERHRQAYRRSLKRKKSQWHLKGLGFMRNKLGREGRAGDDDKDHGSIKAGDNHNGLKGEGHNLSFSPDGPRLPDGEVPVDVASSTALSELESPRATIWDSTLPTASTAPVSSKQQGGEGAGGDGGKATVRRRKRNMGCRSCTKAFPGWTRDMGSDPDYADYLAARVERWAFWLFLFVYNTVAVLIFVLNSILPEDSTPQYENVQAVVSAAA